MICNNLSDSTGETKTTSYCCNVIHVKAGYRSADAGSSLQASNKCHKNNLRKKMRHSHGTQAHESFVNLL